jgi:hypothetical protein
LFSPAEVPPGNEKTVEGRSPATDIFRLPAIQTRNGVLGLQSQIVA